MLMSAATGLSAGDLIMNPAAAVPAAARQRLAGMVARRLQHEPVARILGTREFYGRPFQVTAATLDPRADSETLITAVLEIAEEEGWRRRPVRILDIGTGTGCLLLTLLAELPQATGLGTDVSEPALAVARANAEQLALTARAAFRRQRSLESTCDIFDILVSNPPYIPSGDIPGLALDVRGYDPHGALDGGPDGLAIYREITSRLSSAVPAGWAFFEVGADQATAVTAFLAGAFPALDHRTSVWRDLGGHQRCVAIRTRR